MNALNRQGDIRITQDLEDAMRRELQRCDERIRAGAYCPDSTEATFYRGIRRGLVFVLEAAGLVP